MKAKTAKAVRTKPVMINGKRTHSGVTGAAANHPLTSRGTGTENHLKSVSFLISDT